MVELKRSDQKMILVPFPAQGHVTPMLKLASAFHSRGFHSILVTPDFIHRSIDGMDGSVAWVSIPGGEDAARDLFSIERSMESVMPAHLERLIRDLDGGVACVVVDLLASWAIQVAHKCAVPVAGFWPAMVATYRLVEAIPDMMRTGLISHDTGCPQNVSSLVPNQSIDLSTEDLPWLIGTQAARTARFKFWNRVLHRSKTLKWVLANSFPDEQIKDDNNNNNNNNNQSATMAYPMILPIGPLNQQVITKNPSMWEEDRSCIGWLDQQKAGSVVYISFGSWVSPIGEARVRALARALEASRRPFLWVLPAAWRGGLPRGYEEDNNIGGGSSNNKYKMVSWAPQVEVLGHEAVGCYLTHCGWNSTMEAIGCRKRLLCYPVAGDQFVNCNYIVNVWRVGMRLRSFEAGEVERGLRKVMDGGDGEEMDGRMARLNELTMGEKARSTVMANLNAFLKHLTPNS